jgi:hypothetical protein
MEIKIGNELNIKVWKLILAIIIVNALGIYLRYLNLSTYIILFGFRFHISFVLPLFFVYNSNYLSYIKNIFLNPEEKNATLPLLLILLPFIIEASGFYFLQKINLGDPEYFYEFGISSIADYPIYLIWNFPQMILLFIFLTSVSFNSKFKFISVAFVIFGLFLFELVPIKSSIIQYQEIGILISCSIIFSILINYYKNIYWFGISLFTLFWIATLAFGSSSKTIINLLFASQYNNWEGFFEFEKGYANYTIPIYFGLALIIPCVTYLLFTRSNSVYLLSSRKI